MKGLTKLQILLPRGTCSCAGHGHTVKMLRFKFFLMLLFYVIVHFYLFYDGDVDMQI